MAHHPVTASVVIVGQDVNLSIFRPHWFVKHGIFSQQELEKDQELVIAPVMVQVSTDRFELVILPDRIQFRPFTPDKIETDLMRVLGGIVSTLPHTPFNAVGINYEYLIDGPVDGFDAWNKSVFKAPAAQCFIKPEEGNPRYGAYFSCDFPPFRVRIDCKPLQPDAQKVPNELPNAERMLITLNFNRDLGDENRVPAVLEAIGKWFLTFELAEKIVKDISTLT